MRHLLLLPLMLGIASPTYADLGPADTKPKVQEPNQTKFHAWCVEKYADCLATLEDGLLIVNEGIGISAEQIIEWSRKDIYRRRIGWISFIGPHHLYAYNIKYKATDGSVKEGKIVFQNTRYSDRFYESLKAWAPTKEFKCVYNFDTREESC